MQTLVVGGGYAGVALLRRLEQTLPESVELVLIDPSGTHVIQHQLHRLLRYPKLDSHLQIPLAELLNRTTIIEAEVTQIDRRDRSVSTDTGDSFEPDVLSLCHGAVTAYHGIPGIAKFGRPFKKISHAQDVRAHFRSLDTGDTVVVGGAGLSGIQIAGELAAAASDQEKDIDIRLIERESTVAPTFPPTFRHTVAEVLRGSDISVQTNKTISEATETSIQLSSNESIPYDQFIWTGGITGPAVLAGERPIARADLQVAPNIFGAGDAVRVVDNSGKSVPASAQTAIRQAETVANNITGLIQSQVENPAGFPPHFKRYEFSSPGWAVSVGDDAVAIVGGNIVRGKAAKVLKTGIGAGYLASIGRYRSSLLAVKKAVGWAEYV